MYRNREFAGGLRFVTREDLIYNRCFFFFFSPLLLARVTHFQVFLLATALVALALPDHGYLVATTQSNEPR
jgi:hypothetical protein